MAGDNTHGDSLVILWYCPAAGQSKPEQDAEETTQSQGGLSEAEKAEKKKAKKARQRTARAEAAAQKAEVRQLSRHQSTLHILSPLTYFLADASISLL